MHLGHVVGSGVVCLKPSKVHGVLTFPIPATKTHVRAFLGLTDYYRRFIPNYASLAAPLTDLTKKSAPMQVQWNDQCNQAFEDLKVLHQCSRAQILRSRLYYKQMLRIVDWELCRGKETTAAVIIRSPTIAESCYHGYSTIEKEYLAIKVSMCHLWTYLMGCQFAVETDHRALLWMDTAIRG